MPPKVRASFSVLTHSMLLQHLEFYFMPGFSLKASDLENPIFPNEPVEER